MNTIKTGPLAAEKQLPGVTPQAIINGHRILHQKSLRKIKCVDERTH